MTDKATTTKPSRAAARRAAVRQASETALVQPAATPTRRNSLFERSKVIEAVGTERQRTVSHQKIDPTLIRIWAQHDRDYAALDEGNCADLIDSFRQTGQELPAIVRKLAPADADGGAVFELIVGARRLWTARHLRRELLVEIRTLTDREAFTLQDVENRNRRDISDHERAVSYTRALALHFGGLQRAMATELAIDPANFARLLQLAELDPLIVAAYRDLHDLKVHHGAVLRKLMNEPEARKRVLLQAKALGREPTDGKRVMAALKEAAAGLKAVPAPRRANRTFGGLELVRQRGNRLTLAATLPEDLTPESVASLGENFARLLDSLKTN